MLQVVEAVRAVAVVAELTVGKALAVTGNQTAKHASIQRTVSVSAAVCITVS